MIPQALKNQTIPDSYTSVRAVLPGDELRSELEGYIAAQYLEVHEARVSQFLPILLSLAKAAPKGDTQQLGAVGIRPGQFRPMFLEQYLDQPIEQHIAALCRHPVDRLSLVEIGNLVVSRRSYVTELLVLLATLLHQMEFKWMVFTATSQVEGLTRLLGLNPQILAVARPERLSEEPSLWGNYYENCPKVMVGNLREAATIIDATPKFKKIKQRFARPLAEIAEQLADPFISTGLKAER